MTANDLPFYLRKIAWEDAVVATVRAGAAEIPIVASFGSGLTRRQGDPAGIIWAVSDRGPNIKPKTLVDRYDMQSMRALGSKSGAKIMLRPDIGPRIAKLRVHHDRIELVKQLNICSSLGRAISGLPPPSSEHALSEPAFDLRGSQLTPDPAGLDTEGIAALLSGDFWVADEFGPALVRLDARGRTIARYVPAGSPGSDAGCPVYAILPNIAARRQLNRGFEGIAISPDEAALFLAFQSPLAHPDEAAHKNARHVRFWQLNPANLEVVAQYLYPFDEPASFLRDKEAGPVDWSDLKVSELVALSSEELLVLERGSKTTKIYRVTLSKDQDLPAAHLEIATTPTLEELSAAGGPLPQLAKELLLSSDNLPELVADLEGMVVLSPTELLLVNDNDFGVEGARTTFTKVVFNTPVFPSLAG